MVLNEQNVQYFRNQISDCNISGILENTFKLFDEDFILTTSFGYSGIVLIHHAIQIMPSIPIYFIDTGYHFEETLQFSRKIREEWQLNLQTLRPELSQKELYNLFQGEPYIKNPDSCCYYNKVQPLLEIIHEKSVWISGIRRDQSPSRANIDLINLDKNGFLKISPLYNWTRNQVWEYIYKNNLPYHPLHDHHYPSIGCKPCTKKVFGNRDEREGRWPFSNKNECGMHELSTSKNN
jgi:phosphoadenosine phosphosulfate reductase